MTSYNTVRQTSARQRRNKRFPFPGEVHLIPESDLCSAWRSRLLIDELLYLVSDPGGEGGDAGEHGRFFVLGAAPSPEAYNSLDLPARIRALGFVDQRSPGVALGRGLENGRETMRNTLAALARREVVRPFAASLRRALFPSATEVLMVNKDFVSEQLCTFNAEFRNSLHVHFSYHP